MRRQSLCGVRLVGFCIAEEFLSLLGCLDEGCDRERLPGLAWRLVLGTVLGSVSGRCLTACLSRGKRRWRLREVE